MDGMKLFWGLLLIIFGFVVIGTNVGIVDNSIWFNILSLWPVILIAFGLKLLLPDEKTLALSLFGLLILAVVFVFFTYPNGRFQIKKWNFMSTRLDDTEVFSEDLSDSYDLEIIKKAKVNLSTGAANVKILAIPEGNKENVLYQIKTESMGKISVDKAISGDEVTLDINEKNIGLRLGRGTILNREITLYLPTTLVETLKVDCGASKIDLDYRQLQIAGATLNIGASSGDIYLGDKTKEQTYELSAGASNLNFYVPEQVGVDLNLDGGLNNLSLDSKLRYSTQPTKVTITGSAGVSNIKFLAQ